MNRIFYAMVAIAFLFAAVAELTWTDPEPPAAVVADPPTRPAVQVPEDADPTVRALAEEVRSLSERLQERAAEASPPAEPPPRPMEALTQAIFDKAKASVSLVIGLIGAMCFFLGALRVAEDGGLMRVVSRLIRPLMVRLFPDVPPDHPAMGAMILNLSANALGLGNAATPFGVKAMTELDRLNRHEGTATNAMCLFLAINTSNVTLLPTGVIAWREAVGSSMPAAILPTTLMATLLSTSVAVVAARTLQRLWPSAEDVTPPEDVRPAEPSEGHTPDDGEAAAPSSPHDPDDLTDTEAYPTWVSALALVALVGAIPLSVAYGAAISPWVVPGLVMGMLTYGFVAGVPVYESFVAGAREGWDVAVRIIPFLVAILCAVGMFQASGALDLIILGLDPLTSRLGLPGEALPMALLRPLSGSGAYGIMVSIMNDPATGPDTYTGFLVSTFMGSTETTFYVIAVYFGAVGVQRIRHAMAAALTADVAGVFGGILAVQAYFAWNGLW